MLLQLPENNKNFSEQLKSNAVNNITSLVLIKSYNIRWQPDYTTHITSSVIVARSR